MSLSGWCQPSPMIMPSEIDVPSTHIQIRPKEDEHVSTTCQTGTEQIIEGINKERTNLATDTPSRAHPRILYYPGGLRCGGGGTTEPFAVLGGGTDVDVSRFNSANCIYTMVTAQPASKPESNGGPTTTYDYTLTTTTGLAPAIVRTPEEAPTGLPSYRAQAELDTVLREKESQVLASRARQVRKSPVRSFIGINWNNVYIAATSTYINTTCEYVSDHAYFFVDNRNIAAMSPTWLPMARPSMQSTTLITTNSARRTMLTTTARWSSSLAGTYRRSFGILLFG